jgi:hypothetical protein
MDQDYFAGYQDGITDVEKVAAKVGLIKGVKRFYKGVPIGKRKQEYLQGLRNAGRGIVRKKEDPAVRRATKRAIIEARRHLRHGSSGIAAKRRKRLAAGLGVAGAGTLFGAGMGVGSRRERKRGR